MSVTIVHPEHTPWEGVALGDTVYVMGQVYKFKGFRSYTSGKKAVLDAMFGDGREFSTNTPFIKVNVTVRLEYV